MVIILNNILIITQPPDEADYLRVPSLNQPQPLVPSRSRAPEHPSFDSQEFTPSRPPHSRSASEDIEMSDLKLSYVVSLKES